MPIYRQGQIFTEPRRSGLGATIVGALQGMQEGRELGRKEAQKDIQTIIENPYLYRNIDKEKFRQRAKQAGYTLTGEALGEGGLLPTLEGAYATPMEAQRIGREKAPEGMKFKKVGEYETPWGITVYYPVYERERPTPDELLDNARRVVTTKYSGYQLGKYDPQFEKQKENEIYKYFKNQLKYYDYNPSIADIYFGRKKRIEEKPEIQTKSNKRIKVRRKSDGVEGTILKKDFNPNKYEKIK